MLEVLDFKLTKILDIKLTETVQLIASLTRMHQGNFTYVTLIHSLWYQS